MPELFVESAVNESAARFSNKVKYVFLHSLESRNLPPKQEIPVQARDEEKEVNRDPGSSPG